MKRLVLLGGGDAHLFVLERLARERPAAVEVTLVSASGGATPARRFRACIR